MYLNEGKTAVKALRKYKKFHDDDLPKAETEMKHLQIGICSKERAEKGKYLLNDMKTDMKSLENDIHNTLAVICPQNKKIKKFLQDSDIVMKYFANATRAIEENLKKNHGYLLYAERAISSVNNNSKIELNNPSLNLSETQLKKEDTATDYSADHLIKSSGEKLLDSNMENIIKSEIQELESPKLEDFVPSSFAIKKEVLKSPEFPTLKFQSKDKLKIDGLKSPEFPPSVISAKPNPLKQDNLDDMSKTNKENEDVKKAGKYFPKLALGGLDLKSGTPLNQNLTKKRFFDTPTLRSPETPEVTKMPTRSIYNGKKVSSTSNNFNVLIMKTSEVSTPDSPEFVIKTKQDFLQQPLDMNYDDDDLTVNLLSSKDRKQFLTPNSPQIPKDITNHHYSRESPVWPENRPEAKLKAPTIAEATYENIQDYLKQLISLETLNKYLVEIYEEANKRNTTTFSTKYFNDKFGYQYLQVVYILVDCEQIKKVNSDAYQLLA